MEAGAVVVISDLVERVLGSYWIFKLNEDASVIRSGRGHKITLAKQDLRELENCINRASFFLAVNRSMDREPSPSLPIWISDAQKAAFCLEDQIAMYAIHDSSSNRYLGSLYRVKKAIGMFSTDELTDVIRKHKHSMPRFDEINAIPPFTRSRRKPEDTIPVRVNEIVELKKILLERADPVIFVSGEPLSGKSTLVDKVYEDTAVKNYFKVRSKVEMSENTSLVDLLRAVLKHEEREANSMHPDTIDELRIIEEIHRTFGARDNRYLVVMDDVEDTSALQVLRHILGGWEGKIVCVTRIKDIQYSESHTKVVVHPLEPADQRKLLLHVALRNADGVSGSNVVQQVGSEGEDVNLLVALQRKYPKKDEDELTAMKDILEHMLAKCRGSPWNIRTVGGLLHAHPVNEWKEIKEKQIDDRVILADESDPLVQFEDAQLPSDIRLGFLYCLAFPRSSEIPENSGIPARKLVRLWTAEGFPPNDSPRQSQEQEAKDLLKRLIRSKLLVVEKRGLDGEVLKCRVNKRILSLALSVSEAHKFCRFARDPDHKEFPLRPRSRFIFSRKAEPLNRYRVLAVHGDGDGDGDEAVRDMTSTMSENIRLRSLLYFRTERKEPPSLELSFGHTYKLLRTLELQGTRLARLPSSVACLVCLRYLGLRGTQLEYLPEALQRLRLLMCLDIRDTAIAEVKDVSEFKEMRHLHLANSFRDQSVVIREGLPSLLHLQTLSGAAHELSARRINAAMIPFEQELLYLKLLRKLSVKKVATTSSKDICDAINKMDLLQSLTITCADQPSAANHQDRQFDLSHLEINNNLRKLKLGGCMGEFRSLITQPRMQSIAYLYLWDSKLELTQGEDPLKLLEGLQNLLLLSLYNVYDGVQLTCSNGYRTLKKLSIMAMENINQCTFGTGSMTNLEVLVFAKCAQLKNPPEELDKLGFKQLHLSQMPQEFYESMDPKTKGRVHFSNLQNHFH